MKKYIKPAAQNIRLHLESPILSPSPAVGTGGGSKNEDTQLSGGKQSIWNNDSWGGLDD